MIFLCKVSIQIILRLHFMFLIIAEILHDHMHLPSLNVSFPVSCLCERFLINTRHVRHPQPFSHSSKGRPGKLQWNCKRRGRRGLGELFYVKLRGGGGWQEVLESFLVEVLPPLACHAWWRFSNTAVNSILLSFLAMSLCLHTKWVCWSYFICLSHLISPFI